MPDYVEYIKNGAGGVPMQIRDPEAIRKTGDTMSANLDMGTYKVTNLGTPDNSTDAATKNYVDTTVKDSAFTGDMNNKSITNLADPTNDNDAATKEYVDTRAPKWTLVGSWEYNGSLEADFKQYDELIFLYDRNNDGAFNCCPPIHVPTVVLNDTQMYFGVAYSYYITCKLTLTQSMAKTYEATGSSGSADTDYTIYCYGR